MAELVDVVAYLLEQYPHKLELSNARVTKMVYLSDWKHVLEYGSQLSPIHWYFDNFGPFVWDVKKAADSRPDLFQVEFTSTMYGQPKALLARTAVPYAPTLRDDEMQVLDYVIEATRRLNWSQFIGLVYSTFPIVSSERYTPLDLERLAAEYKRSPLYQSVVPG